MNNKIVTAIALSILSTALFTAPVTTASAGQRCYGGAASSYIYRNFPSTRIQAKKSAIITWNRQASRALKKSVSWHHAQYKTASYHTKRGHPVARVSGHICIWSNFRRKGRTQLK